MNKKIAALSFAGLLALTGCSGTDEAEETTTIKSDEAQETPIESTTSEMVAPEETEPSSASGQTESSVDENADPFTDYWEEFTTAVEEEDAEKVAELSLDPVPLGETGDSLSGTDLIADFDSYFGDAAFAAAISQPADQVEKLVMIEDFAERYNTPVGEEIRQIVAVEGSITRSYVFGLEADGTFKLRSIILLQQ